MEVDGPALGWHMSKVNIAAGYLVLFASIFCVHNCTFTGIEFGGEFTVTTTGDEKSIDISVNQVTREYVSLSITANMNSSDVPVYRNGRLYGRVDLRYNQSLEFIDSNILGGNTYSYQAGGFFFLAGEVWSNIVFVTIPY